MQNSHVQIRKTLGESQLMIPGREGEGETGHEFDLDAYLVERQSQEEANFVYSKPIPKEFQSDRNPIEADAEEAAAIDGIDEGFDELVVEAAAELSSDALEYSLLDSYDADLEAVEAFLDAEQLEANNPASMEFDQEDLEDDSEEDDDEADDQVDYDVECSDDEDDESEYEMPDLAADFPVDTDVNDGDDERHNQTADYSVQPRDVEDDETVFLESSGSSSLASVSFVKFFRDSVARKEDLPTQRQPIVNTP